MTNMQKPAVVRTLLALALAVAAGASQAALPTEATAAFTSLSGNVSDIFSAIWPIIASVVGGFVLISLFKKGASKVA